MEINLKTLNPEQKEAVIHDKGPLLIVAGAGTGKTTVITQRIGYLIEQEKAKSNEILALTFTDKAAGEMEERVDKVLPYGYLDLWVMTFHAFAEKILKNHAIEIGLPNDFKLLNQTEQWLMVRQNLERFPLDFYKPLGNPTKFIHALIKLFSRAKDDLIAPEEYLKYAHGLKLNSDSSDFIKDLIDPAELKKLDKKEKKELMAQEIKKAQEIAESFHIYQQLLLENNALDFGDLINYCLKLFKDRPAILAKYRKQFKYILVDEFQDTNYAQYELVRLLSKPDNNITVVGDDDQSIYKFRGASVSNILEFKKDYPKAKDIFLTKNYRSTQDILDLSYKFIQQNNPDRLEVKLATRDKGQGTSSHGKKLSKELKAQTKEKGVIEHLAYETIDDEIKGVLKQIVDLKEKDKQTKWSDFAILSRTNEIANRVVNVISQTQIPFQFIASHGLYAKKSVLDVLAYLKLLDNYREESAMFRVLNFKVFDLEPQDIGSLKYLAYRKGISIYAALKSAISSAATNEETRGKLKKIYENIEKHSPLVRQKNVGEIVIKFLEDSGYLARLTSSEKLDDMLQVSYLNQLYKKIIEFENSFADKQVGNFLDLIELEMEAGEAGSLEKELDEGPDSVKIMTVHSAKGLEFENVFIINLVDRRFPVDDRPDQIQIPDKLIKEILPEGDAHLQEERRLFYVAMTRAKKRIYFTTAKNCGGARQKKISRFLSELKELGFKLADEEKIEAVKNDVSEGISGIGEGMDRQEFNAYIPKRFSFSQLKAYETCPYQYRFAHVLFVPTRGKATFTFGKTIHAVLQKFYEKILERAAVKQTDLFGNDVKLASSKRPLDKLGTMQAASGQRPLVSIDELLEIYEDNWVDDWYQSRKEHDDYKAKGKKLLTNYYKSIEKNIPRPKYLEQDFNFLIEDEDREYTIRGKIDRVDSLDSGIEIIDYKTGSERTSKTLSPDDKDQLLIYQMAAEQVLSEKVEKLTFHYLDTNKIVSFLGEEKDLNKTKEKMIKIIRAIHEKKFPPQPGRMCEWCDFKGICEYRA